MRMPVDLRSDTVTRPTPEMISAMNSAVLGDDVLGDDPTVTELEQETAAVVGMEAGVFVPSGTMSNQIGLAVHCQRGECILLDEEAHILYYEVGAPAVIAQAVTRTISSEWGIMDPKAIERSIMKASIHTPGSTLLCIENTHNRSGGQVIPLEMLVEYQGIAKEHGMKLHLDGARVFNASSALNCDVREITGLFDSVSICLSKGLGAPVGSVLCGNSDFIEQARLWRKRLGGGMRQSGILAACGLVGLRVQRHRIGEDHARARALALGLSDLKNACVDLDHQATNFVMVDTQRPAAEWIHALHGHGVLAMPPSPNRIRLVTHSDIDDESIQHAIDAFHRVDAALA